jgi:hypothetical protein
MPAALTQSETKLKTVVRKSPVSSIRSQRIGDTAMNAFHTYSDTLDTLAMGLLLIIIVAFYVSLTMEAFRGAMGRQATGGQLRRNGAERERGIESRKVRPAAARARRNPVASRA